jgi:antitoxin CptB
VSDAAEIGRLRWRCRRGTTELDRLLRWFVDQRWAQAPASDRAAFAALLEQQDPDLWDWLSGVSKAPDPDWQAVIDEIRRDYRA